MKKKILSVIIAFAALACSAEQKFDLKPFQDETRLLENPDKGWYHHYYDNSISRYKGSEEDISRVPSLDHLFLRFAWSFLEPEEGKFNWALIDDLVETWSKKGVKISLSITAQETSEKYATPKWVVDAGAKGGMYKPYNNIEVFEPKWDDPVFLEKLENLQKAIAERYDGKDFIRSITIASIGNWGEGHTGRTSKEKVPVDVIKKHIDIYKKYFKKSPLVIGDDFIRFKHTPEEILELRGYVYDNKISYRDDSILVEGTFKHNPAGLSFINPECFNDAAEFAPTTLEMEHYGMTKNTGLWKGKNGLEHGAEVVLKVIEKAQCTYLGYHGYAKSFMDDNPEYARQMANKLGYWLFLDEVVFNPQDGFIEFTWNNKGVARPYYNYDLSLKLKSDDGKETIIPLPDADSTTLKKGITVQKCKLALPADLKSGDYRLFARFYKSASKDFSRPIDLGFKAERKDKDGYFEIGSVKIP